MAIIRNLCPNPSFETGTTGWLARNATLDRIDKGAMQGAAGTWIARATATGTAISLALETVADYQITPGLWYGLRGWAALDTSLEGLLQAAILHAGGARSYVSTGWFSAPFYAGRVFSVVFQAPADATAVGLDIVAREQAAPAANVPAGKRIWADAALLTDGYTSEAGAAGALSAGYHDGDDPGWAWDGTAHASASTGPSQPYSADAVLLDPLTSARLDWLDLVAGYETRSRSRSLVQQPYSGAATTAIQRPAAAGTGRLVAHFTRELATGTPAERSAALEARLRTGAPVTVQYSSDIHGVQAQQLLPTGDVLHRFERETSHAGRRAVWTVEFDYTELAP